MKSFNILALGCGVALNYSFVALVGNVLADVVLVVGDKDALAVAAVLGVELHGGVEGGAGTSEEVKNRFSWYNLKKGFHYLCWLRIIKR